MIDAYRHPGEIAQVHSAPRCAATPGGRGDPGQWGLVTRSRDRVHEIPAFAGITAESAGPAVPA
jgi:hypothetical protein